MKRLIISLMMSSIGATAYAQDALQEAKLAELDATANRLRLENEEFSKRLEQYRVLYLSALQRSAASEVPPSGAAQGTLPVESPSTDSPFSVWAYGGMAFPFEYAFRNTENGLNSRNGESRADGGFLFGAALEHTPKTGILSYDLMVERVPITTESEAFNFMVSPKIKTRSSPLSAWVGPAIGLGVYAMSQKVTDQVVNALIAEGYSSVNIDKGATFFAAQIRAGVDIEVSQSMGIGLGISYQPFNVTKGGTVDGSRYETTMTGGAFQASTRVGLRF